MVFQVVTHIKVVVLLLMGEYLAWRGVVVIASLLRAKPDVLFPYREYIFRWKRSFSILL